MKMKQTYQKAGPKIPHQQYLQDGISSLTDGPGLLARQQVREMWANLPIEQRPSEQESCLIGYGPGGVQAIEMLSRDKYGMADSGVTVRFRPLASVGLVEVTSWLSGKMLRLERVPSKE